MSGALEAKRGSRNSCQGRMLTQKPERSGPRVSAGEGAGDPGRALVGGRGRLRVHPGHGGTGWGVWRGPERKVSVTEPGVSDSRLQAGAGGAPARGASSSGLGLALRSGLGLGCLENRLLGWALPTASGLWVLPSLTGQQWERLGLVPWLALARVRSSRVPGPLWVQAWAGVLRSTSCGPPSPGHPPWALRLREACK